MKDNFSISMTLALRLRLDAQARIGKVSRSTFIERAVSKAVEAAEQSYRTEQAAQRKRDAFISKQPEAAQALLRAADSAADDATRTALLSAVATLQGSPAEAPVMHSIDEYADDWNEESIAACIEIAQRFQCEHHAEGAMCTLRDHLLPDFPIEALDRLHEHDRVPSNPPAHPDERYGLAAALPDDGAPSLDDLD